MPEDPLDTITSLGFRIVWLDNFNGEVLVVPRGRVVLIDCRLDRAAAAAAALKLAVRDIPLRGQPGAVDLPDAS